MLVQRMPDGEYKDIAHPISSATREMIQSAVLKEYEAVLAAAEENRELYFLRQSFYFYILAVI